MKKRNSENAVKSVWLISREYHGLAGAGGVKDVCRQLAESLVYHGKKNVSVVLPRYGFMDPVALGFVPAEIGYFQGDAGTPYEYFFDVRMDYATEERRERVAVWQNIISGVRIYLLETERFAVKKNVYTYTVEEQQQTQWQRAGDGHFDYFAMNILLQKAALDMMIIQDEHPDIIHCQDGHAATLAAMMRENSGYRHFFHGTGVVVTVHNAGVGYHQEVGDLSFARAITELPFRVILRGRLGSAFDPFVAASDYAVINTVSENYGRELQETSEDARTGWLGHTLLERGIRMEGITNGIDPASFSPQEPEKCGLEEGFDVAAGDLHGKQKEKERFLAQLAGGATWGETRQHGVLTVAPDTALLTFVGRLTHQKGVDLLIGAVQTLLQRHAAFQLLVFGSGAPEYEQQLLSLATGEMGRGRVCYLQGYDTQLANRVYAAGDFFLISSRYEPCGLTDYIAQLFGNLPIVHHVGGLVKVRNGETGFAYTGNQVERIVEVTERALTLYTQQPEQLRKMQQKAVAVIAAQYTWKNVMRHYLDLYGKALDKCPGVQG